MTPVEKVTELLKKLSAQNIVDGKKDTGYKQPRYEDISNEMKSILVKVGFNKDMIEKSTPCSVQEVAPQSCFQSRPCMWQGVCYYCGGCSTLKWCDMSTLFGI